MRKSVFARNLIIDKQSQMIPSRPVTIPERDDLVSAPTDCIMNPLVQVLSEQEVVKRRIVENPLQFDTVLDVKGIPITFKGGRSTSCSSPTAWPARADARDDRG
jgi:hypothetical protein